MYNFFYYLFNFSFENILLPREPTNCNFNPRQPYIYTKVTMCTLFGWGPQREPSTSQHA